MFELRKALEGIIFRKRNVFYHGEPEYGGDEYGGDEYGGDEYGAPKDFLRRLSEGKCYSGW
jgi:hypothetical protein